MDTCGVVDWRGCMANTQSKTEGKAPYEPAGQLYSFREAYLQLFRNKASYAERNPVDLIWIMAPKARLARVAPGPGFEAICLDDHRGIVTAPRTSKSGVLGIRPASCHNV